MDEQYFMVWMYQISNIFNACHLGFSCYTNAIMNIFRNKPWPSFLIILTSISEMGNN